jgi:ATP-dependent Clp protease protease subunit
MIEIKVHTLIAHTECAFLYSMDGEDGVFSLETVQRIFEEHPDEKDFRLNIHCQGGEIAEGLAIYDFLRTSGKNIYTNIEGACHSMAIVLLLAAPKENRTANPNSRALIHLPYLEWAGGTADELKKAEEMVRDSQNAILDIYADRTELTREEAERIMAEEQFPSMDEMLKWGFIGKINSYNTNLSKSKHKTMNALLDKITNFLTSLKNEVNEAVEDVKNYIFYGEDGVELFRTEREDDHLEVGMKAEPDGVYEIGERVIVIEGGVITEIRNKVEDDPRDEELNALREQVANLTTQLEQANAQLTNATNLLTEAMAQIKSQGKIGNRVGAPKVGEQSPTREERKAAIKEKLKK